MQASYLHKQPLGSIKLELSTKSHHYFEYATWHKIKRINTCKLSLQIPNKLSLEIPTATSNISRAPLIRRIFPTEDV
jgi:hypothetical protein